MIRGKQPIGRFLKLELSNGKKQFARVRAAGKANRETSLIEDMLTGKYFLLTATEEGQIKVWPEDASASSAISASVVGYKSTRGEQVRAFDAELKSYVQSELG